MRIAYLAQSYPPMISGAAIVVEQLATGMAQRGHPALVIAASDRKHAYNLYRERFTVLRLRSYRNVLRVRQRMLVYPRTAILKALREFQPEVIHAHDPLISWVGFEYARRRNIPTTLTMHMLPWSVAGYLPRQSRLHQLAEQISWMYVRLMINQSTCPITTTKTAADVVAGMTGVQSEIIPCGVDTQIFHPRLSADLETAARTRLNLPPGVPILLHVGRLDREKNVDLILHAAAEIMRQSNAHLLIVGDGRKKDALIKLSKSLGMAERTHFPGYLSVSEGLPEIYRMASLFVMASEVESQGIVLLEAAASGLPIVAVNAETITEIVQEGINGHLVKPTDVGAFSKAISTLLHNPEISMRMGRQSRLIAEGYDIQHSFELHEQFYDALIKRQKAGNRSPSSSSWKRVKAWMGFSE